MNIAELIFEGNCLKISNFSYHQEDVYYNTAFDLEIHSEGFSGTAPCEYDIKEFKTFVDELLEMYDFKKQTVILNDICYGSTVKFEADKCGHIEISGEIYGVAMVQSLKFSFMVDQSVLKKFIVQLQGLIYD